VGPAAADVAGPAVVSDLVPVDAPVEGELQEPSHRPGPCTIETWWARGWYWWRCTSTDHRADGQDRAEAGRAAALARHEQYIAGARAAGEMAVYTPVSPAAQES
jgi:hypothetical protein